MSIDQARSRVNATVLRVFGEPVTRLDTNANLTGVVDQRQDLVSLAVGSGHPSLPMNTLQVSLLDEDAVGLSRGDRLRFRGRDWRIVARVDDGEGMWLFDCQAEAPAGVT